VYLGNKEQGSSAEKDTLIILKELKKVALGLKMRMNDFFNSTKNMVPDGHISPLIWREGNILSHLDLRIL
jgi:hypothetical protein